MRILVILNADAGAQAGGVPEHSGLIEAYYLFSDAGIEVVLAAAGGGSAGGSMSSGRDDAEAIPAVRRFNTDRQARDAMNDLVDLDSVCAEDFDAALCMGLQKLSEGASFLVRQLLNAAKPVAVVGAPFACSPADAENGLLIIGSSNEAARLAANALLGAVGSAPSSRP